jgi:hypothetical protein
MLAASKQSIIDIARELYNKNMNQHDATMDGCFGG